MSNLFIAPGHLPQANPLGPRHQLPIVPTAQQVAVVLSNKMPGRAHRIKREVSPPQTRKRFGIAVTVHIFLPLFLSSIIIRPVFVYISILASLLDSFCQAPIWDTMDGFFALIILLACIPAAVRLLGLPALMTGPVIVYSMAALVPCHILLSAFGSQTPWWDVIDLTMILIATAAYLSVVMDHLPAPVAWCGSIVQRTLGIHSDQLSTTGLDDHRTMPGHFGTGDGPSLVRYMARLYEDRRTQPVAVDPGSSLGTLVLYTRPTDGNQDDAGVRGNVPQK